MPPYGRRGKAPKRAPQSKIDLSKAGREWCNCERATDKERFSTIHNPGRRTAIIASSNSTFVSLKLTAIIEHVNSKSWQLDTPRGRRFDDNREEINHRNREIDARDIQIANACKLEAKRIKDELQKCAKEDAKRQNLILQTPQSDTNIGFLTLRYGRSLAPRDGNESEIVHVVPKAKRHLHGSTAVLITIKESNNSDQRLSLPLPTKDSGSTFTDTTRNQTHQHFNLSKHTTPTTPGFSPITATTDQFPNASSTVNDSGVSRRPSLQQPTSDVFPNVPAIMSSRHGITIADADTGASIREVIYDVHNIQSRLHAFRPENSDGLHDQISKTASDLAKVHDKAANPSNPLNDVRIAQEIIDYVDDGRNPDIYTRDFVDLVLRGNAVMNGKQKAMKDFSKIYAEKLKETFDGMDGEVDMIMGNAGMEVKDGKFVERRTVENGNAVGSR